MKLFHLRDVGDVDLDHEALSFPADDGLTLISYTAPTGAPAREALQRLAAATDDSDGIST